MSASGDPKVFFILISIFVALGIYLIIYNKRKSSFFKRFSVSRGLSYRAKDDGQLERTLNEKIKIEEPNYVRTICRVRDIVRSGEILLFRCTELLDLSKYGNAQNTHFPRVVLSFNVPKEASLFFFADPKTGEFTSKYPPDKHLNEDTYFRRIASQIQEFPPPHPLTVTLSRGAAFIYLEPLFVGGEKMEDLEYLLKLGKKLRTVIR